MERMNETLVFEIKDEQHAPETDTKACYLQKEFVVELMMPDRYVAVFNRALVVTHLAV